MSDSITRSVEFKAPVERVWRALTDHREFGSWFRVALDGPFRVGEATTGRMTYPGYEGWPWFSVTTRMEPPHRLAFAWSHPETREEDPTAAPRTLVEITLEAVPGGTRLTVHESGFEALPPGRRAGVIRGNEEGWTIQLGHVRAHVEA
jgi:uncharacterized protein YndB with AHSA1/START domain